MSCNNTNGADLRPSQYNVSIWRNDTWSQTFSIRSNGEPMDLRGSQVKIQIRKKAGDQHNLLELSLDNGISLIGNDFNQIYLHKKVEIASGNYVYDINVTYPNGDVKTLVWGNFFVQEDVTK